MNRRYPNIFSVLSIFLLHSFAFCPLQAETNPAYAKEQLFSGGEHISLRNIFPTGGRITGGMTAASGRGFYFVSEDRNIYLFDSSGVFLRKERLGGKPLPFSVSGQGGISYRFFGSDTLKALNFRGKILWSSKTSGIPAFDPVINSFGSVITVSEKMVAESFSYRGRRMWERDLGKEKIVSGFAAGSSGRIYAPLADGRIISIDNSGNITGSEKISEYPLTLVSFYGTHIYASDNRGSLFILDENFNPVKTMFLGSEAVSAFPGSSYSVFILRNSKCIIIDSAFNVVLSRSGRFTGAVAAGNEGVALLDADGNIWVFNLVERRSGVAGITPRAVSGLRKTGTGFATAPSLDSYGKLLVAGGLDWNLYFLEKGMFLRDERYGRQKDEASTPFTPDNRYLIYINELSMSDDIRQREKALSLISEIPETAVTAGDEPFLYAILERIAFTGTKNRISGGTVRGSSFPAGGADISLRISAAAVIGKRESSAASSILLEMLKSETDPYAAFVLVGELGLRGSDPDGEALAVLMPVLEKYYTYPGMMGQILETIKKIDSYHGYLPSAEGKKVLFKMLEINRNRDLQLKIIDALKSLDL